MLNFVAVIHKILTVSILWISSYGVGISRDPLQPDVRNLRVYPVLKERINGQEDDHKEHKIIDLHEIVTRVKSFIADPQ